MQKISELIGNRTFKKVKGMSPRRELICQICVELGIPDQYRSGIFFQANNLITNQELVFMKDKALRWEGATKEMKARFFRKQLKEKVKQVKQQLAHA